MYRKIAMIVIAVVISNYGVIVQVFTLNSLKLKYHTRSSVGFVLS